MRNNFIKYIFVVFLIIITIVAYSFYKKDEKETEKKKSEEKIQEANINVVKELRLGIAEYDTINPILSHNRNVQEISKIIFEPLISIDENYNKVNCLATEVSKTEDKVYIAKLRENVKWQDGSDFTANDVKYTIDTIRSEGINSIYKENLKKVENVEVVDNQTIKIYLIEDIPFFEYNLTFPIMSSKYFENEDFNTSGKNRSPIGTGMFKIESSDDNVIKLSRNDEYWNSEKKPVLEKININFYPSMGEVYNDFKNGNIDMVNTTISNVSTYIGTIGFESTQYKSKEYDYLAFNTTNSILASSSVRKAINYSIDKNNIIVSCYGNDYKQAEFPTDYLDWLYEGGVDSTTNLEEAKNILVNDGWVYRNNSWQKSINGSTKKLTFYITVNSENQTDIAVAENIKTQLAATGINVYIRKVSSNNYYDLINKRSGYDAIIININTSYSPNINTYLGSGNMSNYNNDEINQIIKDMANSNDNGIIKEKYKKLIEIYNSEVPFIGLARKNKVVVYNTNLVGVNKPNDFNIFNNIERWYRKNY